MVIDGREVEYERDLIRFIGSQRWGQRRPGSRRDSDSERWKIGEIVKDPRLYVSGAFWEREQ